MRAEAECHMVVVRAEHIKSVGFGEHALVTIGRAVHQQNFIAFADFLRMKFVVAGSRAAHVQNGRHPADELFHPGFAQDGEVVLQNAPLVGLANQLVADRSDDGSGRLGAAVEH